MAEQKKNVRVIAGKVKKGEVVLRSTWSSKSVRLPPTLVDKAAAAPGLVSLATGILDRLMKDAADEMGEEMNPKLSHKMLKRGARVVGIEVTGLKFKVLYALKPGTSLPQGYAETEAK